MDINKIKVLKKAIDDLEKSEKEQELFLKNSVKKQIQMLKGVDVTKNDYKVVYQKPAWKKRVDAIKDKILYWLWKLGLYR